MRIVAGEFKGRAIDSPSEKTTRPTTDRVRESVFSSIYSRVGQMMGLRVLDAFAGSGALGLEALSRGAASCTFFELDSAARLVLEGNVKALGLDARRARVRAGDVLAAAQRPLSFATPFSLVMLDPPYALDASEVARLVGLLADNGDLAPGAVIAYEHAHGSAAAASAAFEGDARFEETGAKKYGKIGVLYLKYVG